jgi:hypothetical protein
MKPRIVADGAWRFRRSPEFQARLRALRESAQTRHEAELAEAGFFRRAVLRWRIAAEYRRERQKIEPSSQSLYSSGIAVSGSQRALKSVRTNARPQLSCQRNHLHNGAPEFTRLVFGFSVLLAFCGRYE